MEQQGAAQPAAQQSTTLAQKADIIAGLSMFPALTVMVFLRRKIGYRFLSPTKILAMFLILWALSGVSGIASNSSAGAVSGYSGYGSPQPNVAGAAPIISSAAPLILFAIIMLITGMVKRYLRWQDIKNGVAWHTYSRGVSWFTFLPVSDSKIKRFVDPLAVAIVGIIVMLIFKWLGYYIIFSAFCLFLFESWDYEQGLNRMLDTLDSLVDSEVVSSNVEHYSKDRAEQRPLEETAGIPTGIAPDIEAQIQRRRNRRRQTPIPPLQQQAAMQQSQYPTAPQQGQFQVQNPTGQMQFPAQQSQYPQQSSYPQPEPTGQLRRQYPPDNLIT